MKIPDRRVATATGDPAGSARDGQEGTLAVASPAAVSCRSIELTMALAMQSFTM